MDVVAGVVHAQPVALAVLQPESRPYRLHVERLAVDRPLVEAVEGRVAFGERQLDGFVRRGRRRIRRGEAAIVPLERWRLDPLRLAAVAGVLDHDAHAAVAIVIGQVAEYPHARTRHLDDGRNALGGAQPQHRHRRRVRHRVAVQRQHRERVAGQGQAADLGGAAIDDVQQHALAGTYADRLAVAEHAAVDRERLVADLIPVRRASGQRGLHRRFAALLQGRVAPVRLQEIHRHVAALAEERIELLQRQEHLAVPGAGLVLRLDVHGPDQAAVLAEVEIGPGAQMRVVETQPRRPGHEVDPAHAAGRNVRGAFFCSAIHRGGQELAVPVQLLRRVGVVVDVHHHRPALFQPQQWPGKLAVVGAGRNDVVGRQLHQAAADAQRVVGGAMRFGWPQRRHIAGLEQPRHGASQGQATQFQELSAVDRHGGLRSEVGAASVVRRATKAASPLVFLRACIPDRQHMIETNPIHAQIADLRGRVESLRGYL